MRPLIYEWHDEAVDDVCKNAGIRLSAFSRRRERVSDLMEWCESAVIKHPKNGMLKKPGATLHHNQIVEDLQNDLHKDEAIKQKCGSIFILLLGNLLIQLFILWLKRRLDEK